MKKLCLLIGILSTCFLDVSITHASTNPQAKDVQVNTSSFSKNLNSSDNTVQKALNTIDQMAGGGGGSAPAGVPGNLQTNAGGGNFGAYAGSTCSGQVAYAISANGVVSCTPYLTLSGLSAASPITYNSTTGAIGWTNSQNYITLTSLNSTMLGLNYNNSTGQFSLTSGYYFPSTGDETTWNAKQSALTFANSLQNTTGTVNLIGDVTSPGVNYYYGTNSGGSKGFYVLPTNQVYPGAGIAVSTGSAWNTSLTAPSSTIVGISDSQTLTNKNLNSGTNTFPTFNQNTTGTSSNVTGTVAVANGGTGQATQQSALNALSGSQTSGYYLRSNGTNVSMTAIQGADVPTLNQNTTGNALTATSATTATSAATAGTVTTAAQPTITSTGTLTSLLVSGNVGINSITPGQKLDVQGTVRTTGLTLSGFTASRPLITTAGGVVANATYTGNTTISVSATGSLTPGDYWKIDASGNAIDGGAGPGATPPAGSTTQVQYNNSGAFGASSNFVFNNNNVGIGTPIPAQILDVNGTVRLTGLNLKTSAITGYVLTTDSSGNGTWQAPSTGSVTINSGTTNRPSYYSGANAISAGSGFYNGSNVGIGTTLNTNMLDVAGGVSIGTAYAGYQSAPSNGLIVQGNVGIGTVSALNQPLTVQGSIVTQGNSAASYITNSNLGIGSTNPGQKLDVTGTVRTTGFTMSGQTPTTGYVLTASDSAGDTTWSAASGGGSGTVNSATGGQITYYAGTGTAVSGLGTSAYTALGGLELANSSVQNFGFIAQNTNSGSLAANFVLNDQGYEGGIVETGSTYGLPNYFGVGSFDNHPMAFIINQSPVAYISTAGNVGIGSANPGQALDVNGTVRNIGMISSSNVEIGTTSSYDQYESTPQLIAINNGEFQANLISTTSAYGGGISVGEDTGSAVVSGARIGKIEFSGPVDGTGINNGYSAAGIASYAEGNWSGSNTNADLILQTTPSSSTSRTTALWVDGSGNVGIGTLQPTHGALQIGTDAATVTNATMLCNCSGTAGGITVGYCTGSVSGSTCTSCSCAVK